MELMRMDGDAANEISKQDQRVALAAPDAGAHTTRAVDRALAILCAFSRETPALGVTELSERLELTKSTVHRLLQVLMARGMVAQDPDRRHYTLGYRVLALAQAVPGEATLRQICQPYMQALRTATEETIGLYVVAGDVRVCLDELESPQMLRMSAGVGRCFPLDRGAAGKALLIDGPQQRELWRRATASLSADRYDLLVRELGEIRSRCYAQTAGETVAGSASLAAPIRGPDGGVMASLSVAGPASRFNGPAVQRSVAALLDAVTRIGRDLDAVYAAGASQRDEAHASRLALPKVPAAGKST
jgi:DNA-binding IclR family transcriptional regulator